MLKSENNIILLGGWQEMKELWILYMLLSCPVLSSPHTPPCFLMKPGRPLAPFCLGDRLVKAENKMMGRKAAELEKEMF